MKRIFVLPCLLLLAACSSVGDAYTIGGRVDAVGNSNARITNMRTSVDNRLEVIEYAQSVGVVPTNTSATQSVSLNSSRVGVSGSPVNRDPNIRDQQGEKIGSLYAQALTAFKNMYKIHTDGFDGLSESEIKNAYLIAGGTGNLDELSNDEMKEFIDDNYASVLSKFFNPGDENTWKFEPKTQSLSDVEMQIVSSDDVLTFTLDDNGQIMAIYLADEGYTRTGDKSKTFLRKDPTTSDEIYATLGTTNLNLKYSDFGSITKTTKYVDSGETNSEIKFFAGGYELKHIDRSTVMAVASENQGLNFEGKTTGVVYGLENNKLQISGAAYLQIKDDTETLNLDFSQKWYDVQITNNGTNQTISFTANGTIDENFQLTELTPTAPYDGMNLDYYGDRGNPSEFVGTATYSDADGVSMETAFGGTLKK